MVAVVSRDFALRVLDGVQYFVTPFLWQRTAAQTSLNTPILYMACHRKLIVTLGQQWRSGARIE